MPLCIDLCSGLGGASQAFNDSSWHIVTVDIEAKFKPTIKADVRFLPLKKGLQPDMLLMSPPCNHFSLAALPTGWPRIGIRLALEIVGCCLEAVPYLKPKSWVMENPRGMLRFFLPKPHASISQSDFGGKFKKPTDLWGSFILPLSKGQGKYMKSKEGISDFIRNPAIRAKWPFGLSQALLEGIEQKQA